MEHDLDAARVFRAGRRRRDGPGKLEALGSDPSIAQIEELVQSVAAAYSAIQGIQTAPPGVDAGAFLAEIGERLFELLLTQYLAAELPAAYNLLSGLKVIELEHSAAAPDRPSFMRVKFQWAEIPKIVTEPAKIPERVYGWGTPDFDAALVLDHLTELFHALRFPVRLKVPDDDLCWAIWGRPPSRRCETRSR